MPESLSIKELLTKMIQEGASDMHIIVGGPPMIRVHGSVEPLPGYRRLTPDQTQELIYSVMTEQQVAEFEATRECDMSFGIDGLSRFRLNVYRDRGSVVAAFRTIPFEILSFEQLGLPRVISDFAHRPMGLVLVCGPTGSGKSTTLAAILDKINRERKTHIITIEDPIEYLHSHKMSIINQREVGADTNGFSEALRRILRQDPDVILIGEMRDPETIQAALTVAETGHLAFATLHTNDALQTINRIVDVFPSAQQAQVRTQLSFVLEGVVVQQLIPRADGLGRVLSMEIMIPNAAIRSLIRAEKLEQIPSMIEIGKGEGMMTMNQSLYRLMRRGIITPDMAFKRTMDPEGLQNLVEKGLRD
ncbi:MAG TPA: type IV pilus twitching motility protein PilT [Candidatus Hydrogenedentes bacterium]|nr:type IV pilus twitching motility protein PilT [Candidatus Hydrogenedentota bacterium]HOH50563.1 type IV pilus twitching motility protein PilT [Candidatus Hydrogenedentota bacterium]HQL93548.1 type IV pilus twitching motility protein PilT [Candidatus Hydrogenedentota bacterium]HRZ15998.1 type IV pilus twitching motility protein PilT [Candidatus Hydrogenedentota bacterium]HRZ82006.1 type IV pilus twitching motility protein PilT [Candidatus Hydrogenedentota bacterium]